MEYLFYYLGPDCRVWRRYDYTADTDIAALEVAWALFKLTAMPHHGFALWAGDRRVHIHNC